MRGFGMAGTHLQRQLLGRMGTDEQGVWVGPSGAWPQIVLGLELVRWASPNLSGKGAADSIYCVAATAFCQITKLLVVVGEYPA